MHMRTMLYERGDARKDGIDVGKPPHPGCRCNIRPDNSLYNLRTQGVWRLTCTFAKIQRFHCWQLPIAVISGEIYVSGHYIVDSEHGCLDRTKAYMGGAVSNPATALRHCKARKSYLMRLFGEGKNTRSVDVLKFLDPSSMHGT